MQDPKIQQLVGQSPFAQAIQNSITAHITEHVAMLYRNKIEQELGVAMPDEDAPLPEDVELELSRVAKEAAQSLLGKNQAEVQQQQAAAQQADPLTQIQQAELKIKQDELQHKITMDMEKLELDKLSKMANVEVQRERLDSEEERERQRLASQERIKTAEVRVKGAEIGAKLTSEEEKNKTATKKIRADLLKEGLQTGKGLADDATNGE